MELVSRITLLMVLKLVCHGVSGGTLDIVLLWKPREAVTSWHTTSRATLKMP